MIAKSVKKPESIQKKSSAYFIIVIILTLLTAVILGVKQLLSPTKTSVSDIVVQGNIQQITKPTTSELVLRVAQHTAINQSLLPTVAEVKNAYLLRLQDPSFYKDVENGDYILIWPDKAVLYSLTKDVVLNEKEINNIQAAQESSTSTAEGSSTSTSGVMEIEKAIIEVRNGSGIVGMGKSMSEKLQTLGFEVLKPSDAKIRKWYEKTIIIKNDDSEFPKTLLTLIDALKAEVVEASSGELPIKGDFLIIVGKDYKP